jgi:hypothetical protein
MSNTITVPVKQSTTVNKEYPVPSFWKELLGDTVFALTDTKVIRVVPMQGYTSITLKSEVQVGDGLDIQISREEFTAVYEKALQSIASVTEQIERESDILEASLKTAA